MSSSCSLPEESDDGDDDELASGQAVATGIAGTPAIFQVKSGKVQRNDIATLNSDRQRENAALAIFITLEDSTKPMRDEAMSAGFYHHELLNRDYPRIQIVTIQEMIEEGRRIDLPLSLDVLKSAVAASTEEQHSLAL